MPEVHLMSASGQESGSKRGVDSNIRSLRVDSLPDLKHNEQRSMQLQGRAVKPTGYSRTRHAQAKKALLTASRANNTVMPKIQRGANSQSLSLSAENSIDRLRFHRGADRDQQHHQVQEGIHQAEAHDMYKSCSSADRIHFFEDQRRTQNLVGDLEGEGAEAEDRRKEQSTNGEDREEWDAEKESNGVDNDNIISIRDSNIEQAVDNQQEAEQQNSEMLQQVSLPDSISSTHLAERHSKLSPSQLREINRRQGRHTFASRQGARGLSHEDEKGNEDIQYIKIQQKNQT